MIALSTQFLAANSYCWRTVWTLCITLSCLVNKPSLIVSLKCFKILNVSKNQFCCEVILLNLDFKHLTKDGSWTECVDLLQGLSEEQKSNRERALFDKGQYRLSPEDAHMRIASAKRLSLSEHQRKRKISQFHSTATKGMLQRQPSYTVTSSVATQDYPLSIVQDD